MDRFTDAELLAIIVALDVARQAVRRAGRVVPPNIFDAIEAKIRPALQHGDDVLDQLWWDGIGDLEWLN